MRLVVRGAVKFGAKKIKCGNPDCHLHPRCHPKQQHQQQQHQQPLLQPQPLQLQLPQPHPQQQRRRPRRNMAEGRTGLTTLTTSTGDLAKTFINILMIWNESMKMRLVYMNWWK